MTIGSIGSQTTTEALLSAKTRREALDKRQKDFMKLIVSNMKNQVMGPNMGGSGGNGGGQMQAMQTMITLESTSMMGRVLDAMKKQTELTEAQTRLSAVQYLGKKVTVKGQDFSIEHKHGMTHIAYDLPKGAARGQLIIRDSKGHTVLTQHLKDIKQGQHSFDWDHTTLNGHVASAGRYTFEVNLVDASDRPLMVTSEGTDKNGQPEKKPAPIGYYVTQSVKGVDFKDPNPSKGEVGGVYLSFGDGVEVALGDLQGLQAVPQGHLVKAGAVKAGAILKGALPQGTKNADSSLATQPHHNTV